jgi:hypothetical protein
LGCFELLSATVEQKSRGAAPADKPAAREKIIQGIVTIRDATPRPLPAGILNAIRGARRVSPPVS